MILGIDVDGVLADFNSGFIQRTIEVTGKDLFPPRPFDIPTWDYATYYGYTKDEEAAVWESIKSDRHFWSHLNAYPGVENFIEHLWAETWDVYFITARPGIRAKIQTEHWLQLYDFELPTVLISWDKDLCAKALKLDRYVDDRIENAIDVVEAGIPTYLLTRPWNKNFRAAANGIIRISSLEEFLK